MNDRKIDLGDELLAQVMQLVQNTDLPIHRKPKSLVRDGKIGEMYLGPLADDCSDAAVTAFEGQSSLAEKSIDSDRGAEPSV